MANPSMVPPGPGMAGQAMVPGSSGQMHLRTPRPSQTGLLIFEKKSTCQMSIQLFCIAQTLENGILDSQMLWIR